MVRWFCCELAYSYGQEPGKRFRLGTVTDSHHRVAGTGTPLGMLEDTHSYGYDADGNLTYVSTARIQADGTVRGGVRERRLLWDAEGRMRTSDDGGYVTAYVYDADGNRTVKQSGGSAHLYVNSAAQSGVTSTRGFTLYVGPWMTANEAGRYTKHFYAGGERVASKVGNVADYRGDELTGPCAGDDVGGVTVDYAARYAALTARIAEMYAELGVPYVGTDNDRNGALLSRTALQGVAGASQDDGTEADGLTADGGSSPAAAPVRGEEETMRFFYHPDHLGSASYVTDRDGALVQHLEYAPFGEVFLDERGSGGWSSPYLFNAKELDPETGLYYYGARYYDPRLAMWISPDPLQEKYPEYSSYVYATNNPVKFIDIDGQDVLIWYEDNKGHRRTFRFSGFHGQRSITIPNNQYVKDFIEAYLYNAKHGGGNKTIQVVTNHKYKIYVSDTQHDDSYYYGNEEHPTIYWKSRQGIITTEGGRLSAATTLEHEMDHAIDDINNHKLHEERILQKDSQYKNKEERRVITGSEAQTAKGNNEAIRRNHFGRTYRAISPISTKSVKK